MHYLFIPKICRENKITLTEVGSKKVQEKSTVFDSSRLNPEESSLQSFQIASSDYQGDDGINRSCDLGTRYEISNRSIPIANTFQSLKELIVSAKCRICQIMGSVIRRLVCTLEGVRSASSLAGGRIRQLLPEPYASFTTQFMFGKQSQTNKELYQLFKTTGMLDLLVISGFHLQITASLCYASIIKFSSKTQASVLVLICIWAFMLMLPQSIPVERAVLATTVALTAKLFNRPYNPKLTLIAIAMCMFIRDNTIISLLSFQLSFLASAIILWVYPIITGIPSKIEDMSSGGLIYTLVEAVILSLVVSIAFAPLLSYYFGFISLVGLIISPIFSLFLPLIFIAIWVLTIFPSEGFWLDAGILVASILKGILEGLFHLMEQAAKIKILSFNYKIESVWLLIAWYSAIIGFVAINYYKSQKRLIKQTKMQIVYD